MSQTATTIYLNETQRKRLFTLAKGRKTSFSSEIRAAIDKHVERGDAGVSDEEARLIISQAHQSMDRIARVLDETHAVVSKALGRSGKIRR